MELEAKPQIVVANKMDSELAPEFLQLFKEAYPDLKVFETSTLEHKGLDAVLYAAMDCIEEARKTAEENTEEAEDIVVYRYEPKRPDFEIVNLGNGRWKVVSKKVDRLAEQVDFDKEDDTYQFALTLQKMGIDAALYEAGARDGDTVIIGTYIMDYTE
jgi:GTP-binding protein